MGATKDVDQVVSRASVAHDAAARMAPSQRAGMLRTIAEHLDRGADELVPLAMSQTHLPEPRLRGELARTTFQLRLFAEEIERGELLDVVIDHSDESWGMGPRPDIRRMNVPLGVVGVFGASNFPFAFSVMGGDSASALAAGCAVVHKIHEAHEALGLRTAEIVAEALRDAGAPEGLFATVTGREAGEALVDHPLVKAIGFTGSTRVGRLLMDRAQRREEPIPFYGELGSVNPVFVTRSAWQERSEEIATGYVDSFTLGAGQFCTKPGIIVVPELAEADRALLSEAVAAKAPARMLSENLARGYEDARSAVLIRDDIEALVDGAAGESVSASLLHTTAAAVRRAPDILSTEVFGPASVVVEYTDERELTELAALIEGQLTTTVHGTEGDDVGELLALLTERSGRVLWNGWPTGVTVSYGQQHGGPYPATTAAWSTSVGTSAARRFMRPVAYQNFPASQLPPALQDDNPLGVRRRVNGVWEPEPTR